MEYIIAEDDKKLVCSESSDQFNQQMSSKNWPLNMEIKGSLSDFSHPEVFMPFQTCQNTTNAV